jgi:hypothetical protein
MNVQRAIAYVLGGVAAGGAVYYGISKYRAPEPRRRGRSDSRNRETLLVRVTENGRKYHRDSCPLLHGETRVIPVSEALENYEPCKACHPPGGLDLQDEGFRVVGTVASGDGQAASTDGRADGDGVAESNGAPDAVTEDEAAA